MHFMFYIWKERSTNFAVVEITSLDLNVEIYIYLYKDTGIKCTHTFILVHKNVIYLTVCVCLYLV